MNIGIVVNARGEICLVHDEQFEAVPLWVAYHVDRRSFEIIFETGHTYPIEWEATEEMDALLPLVRKILIIRMEDRHPVEGYDTSLLQLRGGRTTGHKIGRFKAGEDSGTERDGFLRLRTLSGAVTLPSSATYAPWRNELTLDWPSGESKVTPVPYSFRETMLRYPTAFFEFKREDETQGPAGWLPLDLNLALPEPVSPTRSPIMSPRISVRCMEWDEQAEVATLVRADEYGAHQERPLLLDREELTRAGLGTLQPGDELTCTICESGTAVDAALDPATMAAENLSPGALVDRKADPAQSWLWWDMMRTADGHLVDHFLRHFRRLNWAWPEGRGPEHIRMSELPFYDDAFLVGIAAEEDGQYWLYLWSPRRIAIVQKDHEGLMLANAAFGLDLEGEKARAYLLFALSLVPELLDPVHLIFGVGDIPLDQERDAARIEHLAEVVFGPVVDEGDPDFAAIRAVVQFRSILFSSRLLIARTTGELAAAGRLPTNYKAGQIVATGATIIERDMPVQASRN